MIHESPYDQRGQEARDEDRRQALHDAGEDEMNERRQLGDDDEEMTVGLDCCPHFVPYGSDCDRCDDEDQDAAYEPGDPKRSDFLGDE